MAFTLVQHVQSTATGNSPQSLSFGSNITTGNLVVIFVQAADLSTVPTVTDASNTYTNAGRAANTSFGQDTWSFYKANVTGGNKAITATQASGTGLSLFMMEWSGVATSNALDGHNENFNTVANQAAVCSSSFGKAGDLVVAGTFISGLAEVPSGSGGLTVEDSSTVTGVADGFINSASGAVTPGFSWTATTGNVFWGIAGMAFLPAAQATRHCGSLALAGVGCSMFDVGAAMRMGALFWAGKKLQENPVVSRRGLLLPRRRKIL